MNYWPVFNTNLSDMFDSYMAYNEAFRKLAMQKATEYIKKNNPSALSKDGDNGWTIGTGATAFGIEAPGKHSGPGTGGIHHKAVLGLLRFHTRQTVAERARLSGIVRYG